MKIYIKSIIGIIFAFFVGLSSATSRRGEYKRLCNNDIRQSLSSPQLQCIQALQSSPVSTLNLYHCVEGSKISLRKTCLATCLGEEVTLTSYGACSARFHRLDEISSCRRGYESTLDSITLLLGIAVPEGQESAVHIQSDESINVVTSIDEESTIDEDSLTIETVIEDEAVKNESVSLVFDDHSAESFSSLSEEEKTTILSVSTKFDESNGSLITNSSIDPINQSTMPRHVSDQGLASFNHTTPCLGIETNQSFVEENVSASFDAFDVSLEFDDDQLLLVPAISQDIIDDSPSPVASSIYFTSITFFFDTLIIIWLAAARCWIYSLVSSVA